MNQPPGANTSASLRRIRWAQVITFSVVVLALLATAAQSLIGAQRSAENLTLGQGRRLLQSVQSAHRRWGPEFTQHASDVLSRGEEFGLRCIGIFRREYVYREGDCILSEAAMREALARNAGGSPLHVGDHVVMIDDVAAFGGPPPGAPPHRRGGGGRHPGPPPREPNGGRGAESSGHPEMAPPPPDAPGMGAHPRPEGNEKPQGPPPVIGGPLGSRHLREMGGPPDGPPRRGRGPGPGPRGPRGPAGPPPVLIEFEPIDAEALQGSVAQSAIVAVVAVLALLFGTFALVRLTRRAETLHEEAERDRRLVSLGQMASVLAHEIKNPLAALKGHAQLLAERLPEDGRERRSADRVVHSAVRLEALTEDLLSLVRSNRVDAQEVSPETLVRDSLGQVDCDAFEIDVESAPAHWRLDPNRMQQVLVNLLQNAADASPEGSAPSVSAFEKDDSLVFRVRDHGPGLPAGEEERIFEPFFTKKTQGTGLGLAVAQRIVELHGGAIQGRTLDSGGAEFEVVIP